MKRHYIDRTHAKCTRNLHAVAELRYPLEWNKCSTVTCIFLRRFKFCYQNISKFIDLIEEIQKYPVIFQRYCNICNNITCMHILFCRHPCLFLFQQKIMSLIGISNFLTGFLLLSIYVKNELVEINSVNFSSSLYTCNEHVTIATSWGFSVELGDVFELWRKAPRNNDRSTWFF